LQVEIRGAGFHDGGQELVDVGGWGTHMGLWGGGVLILN
jgi:hypothetical protein